MIFSGTKFHPFHIVSPSPWPLTISISAMFVALSAIAYMHSFKGGLFFLIYSFLQVFLIMGLWFRDIVREATFEGKHTRKVKNGIKMGFILFIVSEIMFFFGFFFAFFYTSLDPSIFLGRMYPPITYDTIYPGTIPLFATAVLLLSSCTITTAHSSLIKDNLPMTIYGLFSTLFLAVMFTFIQYQEYINASFTISDGIVGSNFFMITGLHGFHVIIGSIFILISTLRFFNRHFTSNSHLGFELCVWYWHFVDVVWFFVMFFIYFLGGGWFV